MQQMQMEKQTIDIVQFDPRYQTAVEELVLPIQQIEFGVRITREDQPDLMDIKNQFQCGNGNFWVALSGDSVVGTIGVFDIGNKEMALKKMFVHQAYRGKEHGVAAALMQSAKQWCVDHEIKTVYLGTTTQMTAAQRFYQKHGYVELEKALLPTNFPVVHVDTKFYRCDL